MHDTSDIREKMLVVWKKMEAGEITATEARAHIGFARTILDTLKVEIAAAHLNSASVPPVTLARRSKIINVKARKAA